MKTRKALTGLFALLLVLAIAALGAKPLYNLYRDISFGWEERSEQEHIVKDYAETMGISYGEYPISLIELSAKHRNPNFLRWITTYTRNFLTTKNVL